MKTIYVVLQGDEVIGAYSDYAEVCKLDMPDTVLTVLYLIKEPLGWRFGGLI